MKDKKSIVARLVAVLGAFADGEPALAISQLSERLRLPPSSIHRLLEQLIALEVIERASHRRYRIGPEFFRIGVRVENKFRIVEVARPLMQKLVDQLHETCVLSVLLQSQQQRLRVAKLDSPQDPLKFRLQMLERHSLVWGAAGRAILAYMEPDEIKRVFAQAPPTSLTGRPLPSFAQLTKELERIRACGYAVGRDEFLADTIGIAAPLFGPGERVVGELGIIMPAFRFRDDMLESLSAKLLQTTQQLSAMLGGARPPPGKSRTTAPRNGRAPRRARPAYARRHDARRAARRASPNGTAAKPGQAALE